MWSMYRSGVYYAKYYGGGEGDLPWNVHANLFQIVSLNIIMPFMSLSVLESINNNINNVYGMTQGVNKYPCNFHLIQASRGDKVSPGLQFGVGVNFL